MPVEHWCNDADGQKPKYSERNGPNSNLSATNPTWIVLELIPFLHGDRQVTKRVGFKSVNAQRLARYSQIAKRCLVDRV
jgi:hypothetical protein